MLLDAVLERARRDAGWRPKHEKLQHFTHTARHRVPARAVAPSGVRASRRQSTGGTSPSDLPIGLVDEGARTPSSTSSRGRRRWTSAAFLHRHAELLRALPRWPLRVLLPPHLRAAEPVCRAACHQELATPLPSAVLEELRWYFEQRHAAGPRTGATADRGRGAVSARARAFAAPRYQALYRAWRRAWRPRARRGRITRAGRRPRAAHRPHRVRGAARSRISISPPWSARHDDVRMHRRRSTKVTGGLPSPGRAPSAMVALDDRAPVTLVEPAVEP